MKKVFAFILSCVCLIYLFTGCKAQDSASAPNAGPPAIMVDDILYYSTGKKISVERAESDFSGRITSAVSISQMPTENGQANIPFERCGYVAPI